MPSVLRGCVRAPPRAPRAGQGVRPPCSRCRCRSRPAIGVRFTGARASRVQRRRKARQAAAVPDAVQGAVTHQALELLMRRVDFGPVDRVRLPRQPSRWSGRGTGRPPVKMAARPVVTWSKRAGSSPSTSHRPRRPSFPPGPCSRRRRGRCGSAAPRCAGCRRRTRRGGVGQRRSAGAPRTPRRLRPARTRRRSASCPTPGSWSRRRRRGPRRRSLRLRPPAAAGVVAFVADPV